MRALKFVVLIGLIALSAASGCGYKIGMMHRSDVKTIAIPVWTRGHGVFRRGLEMDLTKAVINCIQVDTRYSITSAAKADTKLTGQIDEIRQRPLSINTDTGRARAMETTFIVSFKWVDLRSGDVLVKKDRFQIIDQYIGEYPFGETFFTGSQAVIDQAAQRIVEQLEQGWPESFDKLDADDKK